MNFYKTARKINGFSKEEAAQKAGITCEELTAIETGKFVPDHKLRDKLMSIYYVIFCAEDKGVL